MKKYLFIGFLAIAAGFSGLASGQEEVLQNNIQTLANEVKSIWPRGNCADNLSGNENYVMISIACSSDFSAHDRRAFLQTLIDKGWNLVKETYRIDANSAGYFYKFSKSKGKFFYVKLFFRNPMVVWPVHENHRPKIAVVLENVKNPETMNYWSNIKLPLTVSLNISGESPAQTLARAMELNYDRLVYYPANIEPENPDIEKSINTYLESLKSYPEESFPFSGLSISPESIITQKTAHARALIKAMKSYGLNKIVSPDTLEISDTAKVLGMNNVTHVYYMKPDNNKNKTIWTDAYNDAKKTGYSVIVIDAEDIESRTFLLSTISENLNFVDFVKISDLPISPNKF